MQDTGIFKWVWRFNAVVIALGAVLLVLLVGSEVLRPMFRAAPLEAVEVEPMPDAPPPQRSAPDTVTPAPSEFGPEHPPREGL